MLEEKDFVDATCPRHSAVHNRPLKKDPIFAAGAKSKAKLESSKTIFSEEYFESEATKCERRSEQCIHHEPDLRHGQRRAEAEV